MKDIFSSLVLGISIGIIISGAYYDGFVSDEHRRVLERVSLLYNKQSSLLKETESENKELKYLLQQAIKQIQKERELIKTI